MYVILYFIGLIIVACIIGEVVYRKEKKEKNNKIKRLEYLCSHDTTDEEYPEYNEQQFINRFETNIWELR